MQQVQPLAVQLANNDRLRDIFLANDLERVNVGVSICEGTS